jgi:hypothetical protein
VVFCVGVAGSLADGLPPGKGIPVADGASLAVSSAPPSDASSSLQATSDATAIPTKIPRTPRLAVTDPMVPLIKARPDVE